MKESPVAIIVDKKKSKPDEWDVKETARVLKRAQEIRDDKVLFPLTKKQLEKDIKESETALEREKKVSAKLKETFKNE